ncbi:MAG: hypothetical protein ACHQET_12790 [Chitinophagales bacterium]
MNKKATQQEVLLLTDTSFAHRQWVEKGASEAKQLSDREQLELACWNGILKNTLPEIDAELMTGKKLWLWLIKEANSFLELQLSDYPYPFEKWASIDPYSFLPTKSSN